MDLHRIGFKFFLEDPGTADPPELIPIFHRWIQEQAVEGLLIDVADYSHVPDGPGILLVAHEGNYALDQAGGRPGFLYYRKRPLNGAVDDRFARVARTALLASQRLENEPELEGRVRFRTDRFEVFSNDRLAAPNTDEGAERFEAPVRSLADRLWDGAEVHLEREPDPRERLTFDVRAATEVPLETLVARLGS